MKTINDIKAATDKFFERHWNTSELPTPKPVWDLWGEFLYGSVPNYDSGGCYVLLSGEVVIYVGLGASRGGGLYPNHGISRRLMSHVIASDKSRGAGWSKLKDTWGDVTAIHTIGFPSDVAYLAVALESYLIRELSPPRNSRV